MICTLKTGAAPSSSELIADQLLGHMGSTGVATETVRCVDLTLLPGVQADMGPGDEWPALLEKIKAADILVISIPTWVGHMSSVAQPCTWPMCCVKALIRHTNDGQTRRE